MSKITITTTSFGVYDKSPMELCSKSGYEIVMNPHGRKITSEELSQLAKESVGLIAGTELITEKELSKLNGLKVISRCGVGIDNVDLKCAEKMGIKVYNTPDGPTLAVAELTVGLILSLIRKIGAMDVSIRNGEWKKQMGNLLFGKKVGIVGFGRIGKKVAELLKPFGCEIGYYDPYTECGLLGLKHDDLGGLFQWANIVTLHVPKCDLFISENELGKMKKGSWMINVSRGGVVDENVLYNMLADGHLEGAAIDVFEKEPYDGEMRELDNVILTPHVGSYAKEARINMEMQTMRNLLEGLGAVS